MINFLKSLFGTKEAIDFKALTAEGAVIVDVRSAAEYSGGHIENSLNVPLQNLTSKVKKLKRMNQPIITCCASGIRSQKALSILKANEIEVYNGGGWYRLQQKIAS